MASEDITNRFLALFTSAEFVIAVVLAAIAWGVITTKVEGFELAIKELEERHEADREETVESLRIIQEDVKTILLILGGHSDISKQNRVQENVEGSSKDRETDESGVFLGSRN